MRIDLSISRWLCAALCLAPFWVSGADVVYFGIVKSQQFTQTNSSAPAPLASNAFLFTAFVVASSNTVVTNATVTPPAKPTRTLLSDSNGLSLRYEYATNTQAQLDALFPSPAFLNPANYSLTMSTVNDGTKSVTLSWTILGFPIGYPPTAQVIGFPEAQDIDHTQDFTLRWTASGGNALDIVQVLVMDGSSNLVFASPVPFTPGALNGTSTSVVIPANTLPPDTVLQAHLAVARPALPNTNDYVGTIGVPALAKDTGFSMRTRPVPRPPLLELAPRVANQFLLRLRSESNRLYQILATEDFLTWTNLLITNSASGTFDFTDPEFTNFARRFYRGKVGQ